MANYINGQEVSDRQIVITEADATLSGTPKLVLKRDINGNLYYEKVYPTKA
jgi:hypothetical protein